MKSEQNNKSEYTADQLVGMLVQCESDAHEYVADSDKKQYQLKIDLLGPKSQFGKLIKHLRNIPKEDKKRVGETVKHVKQSIESIIAKIHTDASRKPKTTIDITAPGIRPPQGHLHIVSQAIIEITKIFSSIGFYRARYPEVDWDWYPFESLNMPPNHPARDEWETFFVHNPKGYTSKNPRSQTMVLTPHTSNGQVREMELHKPPIRMINISKCYRRQVDVSHTPMFHQFEGLYIDKNVSIAHLKGVFDYFVKRFYSPDRQIRLRPYHFQFTEPSFEVDISCGVCSGKGCKLCKEGWLELGGAGMVHPVVLKNGGIDTKKYNGFAFGWGIERVYMMKSGTKLADIRWLYSNDLRFLQQF